MFRGQHGDAEQPDEVVDTGVDVPQETATLPDDALEGQYFPDQDAWNDGDRKILCYAQSATGFPGPVMNRE